MGIKKREEIRILSEYLNMVKWENKSIDTLRAVRKAYLESHDDSDTVSLPGTVIIERWVVQGRYMDHQMHGRWIDIDMPRKIRPTITEEERERAISPNCEMRIVRREIREYVEVAE